MEFISANKDTLDLILQVLVIVLPVVLSWFVRSYVRSNAAEKQIGSIARLSNAAIDYVENLDKRGDLVLSPDARKGIAKLNLAADWLESELSRNGIRVTTDEAKSWISAEYQKRVGDPRPESDLREQAKVAVDLIQAVEGANFARLLKDPERLAFLAQFAADWIVSHLAHQRSATITHTEALSWVNAEILQRIQPEPAPAFAGEAASATPGDLAHQAVVFLQELKERGLLTIASGTSAAAVERDLAVAWMMTEAAKQGRVVSPQEIARAVNEALRTGNTTVPA